MVKGPTYESRTKEELTPVIMPPPLKFRPGVVGRAWKSQAYRRSAKGESGQLCSASVTLQWVNRRKPLGLAESKTGSLDGK